MLSTGETLRVRGNARILRMSSVNVVGVTSFNLCPNLATLAYATLSLPNSESTRSEKRDRLEKETVAFDP